MSDTLEPDPGSPITPVNEHERHALRMLDVYVKEQIRHGIRTEQERTAEYMQQFLDKLMIRLWNDGVLWRDDLRWLAEKKTVIRDGIPCEAVHVRLVNEKFPEVV